MAKAVLVMDMPECCADCPCSFFERDNPILNLICGVTQEDAYNVGMFRAGFNACLNEIMRQGMSDSVD